VVLARVTLHSGEVNMKVANSLGGALFALGLMVFLYGTFNQAVLNLVTAFETAGPLSYATIHAMTNDFRVFQFVGGLAAVSGAGLACLRRS
jgi:hypothetical protein